MRMSTRIILIAALAGGLLGACTPAGPLPHSIYFLDGPPGEAQVWRLERDGVTRTQLTREPAGVDAFAVSGDGRLAFVTGNALFVQDAQRTTLIADGNRSPATGDEAHFRNTVSTPVFSPDGRTLAYAHDGLHLYDLAAGTDQHALTNLGNLLGELSVFEKENYAPGPWSPDGRRLLIIMGYYEGSTLAVMEPGAAQPYTRLRTDGPTCCLFSWADKRTVLAANPYFTTDLPGLWRYDALTGARTELIAGIGADGWLNYVGWPLQLPSGDLLFFHAHLERFSPDEGIPLVLTHSDADGADLRPLRGEAIHVWDVLWTTDGSLAVIQGRIGDGGPQVLLVRPDSSPLLVLIEDAARVRGLAWGP